MIEIDFLVILSSIIVNVIPAFSPISTFGILAIFQKSYPSIYSNVFYLIFLGILGSTVGRVLLAKGIYMFSNQIENKKFHKNLEFFEKLMTKSKYYPLFFSSIYCLFPTPTNWLFIPAGKNNFILAQISLGHALGRIINYWYTLVFIDFLLTRYSSNPLSPINLLISISFGLFILLDWEKLFTKREFSWIFTTDKKLPEDNL